MSDFISRKEMLYKSERNERFEKKHPKKEARNRAWQASG